MFTGRIARVAATLAFSALLLAGSAGLAEAGGSAQLAANGSRAVKQIALTFDDGWNVPGCISIVDTLKAQKVTATFFPNGMYVREDPTFWRWVAAQGFPIGTHTMTHHDLRTLTPAAISAKLQSDLRVQEAATGVAQLPVLRPPYGYVNATVLSAAGADGYSLALNWDVDSMDQEGVTSVAQEVRYATKGRSGSVILMHCGSPYTPGALPAIIAFYKAHGYRFVTVAQMFGIATPPAAAYRPLPITAADAPTTAIAPADVHAQFNPSEGFDAGGHAYAVYETPTGIELASDASGTWVSTLIASPGRGQTFMSHPQIAVQANGRIHVVWLTLNLAGAHLQYRSNASGAWGPIETVSTLGAPASTASIALLRGVQPIVAYTETSGAGVYTSVRTSASVWTHVAIPGTDRTWLNPSIAVDPAGKIHIFARRNGYSTISEATNSAASGRWHVYATYAVSTSAVVAAVYGLDGTLYLANQTTNAAAVGLWIRHPGQGGSQTVVLQEGDLGGVALDQVGSVHILVSRVDANGLSRIWGVTP
jgi:peptidoglycan/xylan/chitin deacetylase (PgdA/CDA1 family)